MRAPFIVLIFFLFLIAFVTLWVTASFINANNVGYTIAGAIQTTFFLISGILSVRYLNYHWNRWS